MNPVRSRMSSPGGRSYNIFFISVMADRADQSGVVKHKRGKPLTSGEKVIIFNLFGL